MTEGRRSVVHELLSFRVVGSTMTRGTGDTSSLPVTTMKLTSHSFTRRRGWL